MRTRRSTLFLAALALAFGMSFGVVSAYAGALEDPPQTSSSTNPDHGVPSATWRYNWGNSLSPDMQVVTLPSDGSADTGEQTLGFIYEIHQVDQSDNCVLVPNSALIPSWGNSWLSPDPNGTMLNTSFSIPAVVSREGWWSGPGAHRTGEGCYLIGFLFYNQYRVENPLATDFRIRRIDLTPPRTVQNLTSNVAALQNANGWTESASRNVSWTPQGYDDLSGVGGFAVSVNGTEVAFAQNVSPDPAFEPYASNETTHPVTRSQLHNVTVEGIPAGHNLIGITTVDRATNQSATMTVNANVDPDTPSAVWASPSSSLISGTPKLSVNASDEAGITSVKFYLDSTLLGTSASTKTPYVLAPNLSGFSNGTHTLKCVVADQIGYAAGTWLVPHTRTITKTVTLDRTAPSLSVSSAGPNPFFPRYRDNYKDNFVVSFSAGENCTAYLYVYNSAGKVYQTLKKSMSAGKGSFSWNGKSSGGAMNAGTFRAQLKLVDAAGNASTSGKYTATIKFYELVKTSGGTVKVVPR